MINLKVDGRGSDLIQNFKKINKRQPVSGLKSNLGSLMGSEHSTARLG